MLTPELLKHLKAPFPAEDHKERELQGGGRWFFIPWQKIKERLDECAPDWQVSYSDPVVALDLVVVRCRLTINGISRQGVGNSDFKERTQVRQKNGEYKDGAYKFGSPVECAAADAFKQACEHFGICSYLDDQKFVAEYLRKKGDGRGQKFANERDLASTGVRVKPIANPPDRAMLCADALMEVSDLVSLNDVKRTYSQVWDRAWKMLDPEHQRRLSALMNFSNGNRQTVASTASTLDPYDLPPSR